MKRLKKDGITFYIPANDSKGMFIALGVLLIGFILEAVVLHKAAKEILHEVGDKSAGLMSIPTI